MSQSPIMPSEPTRQRWQFSIGGLMLFTASVAIGLSAMGINKSCWFGTGGITRDIGSGTIVKTGWLGGLLAALVFWMGWGVLHQVRDLRACLAANPDLDAEQRFGGRFEIFWRLGVVFLFVTYAVVAVLLDRGVFIFQEAVKQNPWSGFGLFREGIFLFLLLTLVGSVPAVHVETKSSRARWIVSFLAGVAAITFCLLRWMNETSFCFLAETALYSIDSELSNAFSAVNARRYAAGASSFFWWSALSGMLVLVNGIFLSCLARQWAAGIGRRLNWSIPLILGIAATSCFAVWASTRGLSQISPFLTEAGGTAEWQGWVAAGLFGIVFVTTVTYRLTVDRVQASEDRDVRWRVHADKYFHEWRSVLLLLAITLILLHSLGLYKFFVDVGLWSKQFFSGFFWNSSGSLHLECLTGPVDFLGLALILVIFHRTFAKRKDCSQSQSEIPGINRAKFLAIWLATAAFTVSGALAWAWMSFGLWFGRY